MNNLIKINVYYTSLTEKTTEDVIDYNIEVRLQYKTLFLSRECLCSVFLNVFSNASDLNVKVMLNY